MLFDKHQETRIIALKKILRYRKEFDDPLKVRVYKKPIVSFQCTDYMDLNGFDILNKIESLYEPPFTQHIPYDQLEKYLEYDDPPLHDPQIPLHIQGIEKHVAVSPAFSKRFLPKSQDSAEAATLPSREKLPGMCSKKNQQK